jgi:hypothetical protein
MAEMTREELDRLAQRIAAAREQAKRDGLLPDPDEPRFYESGTIHPELDDPTIAPG